MFENWELLKNSGENKTLKNSISIIFVKMRKIN